MTNRSRAGLELVPGLFGIESDELGVSTRSAQPMIQILTDRLDINEAYARSFSKRQFLETLQDWGEVRDSFPIVLASLHGFPGGIEIGSERILLDEIAVALSKSGSGGLLHFSCCSVLDVPSPMGRNFLKASRLDAITGYSRPVDFIRPISLELEFMGRLFAVEPSRASIVEAIRGLKRAVPGLVEETGFTAYALKKGS